MRLEQGPGAFIEVSVDPPTNVGSWARQLAWRVVGDGGGLPLDRLPRHWPWGMMLGKAFFSPSS